MGFPNAVGPETVQAAAATCNTETSSGDEAEQNGRCGIGKRKSLGLAYIGNNLMPGQAYSTLAAQPNFFAQNGQGRLSLLHELSHLPQQFAELTLDQIYALKKRCEEEFQAVRRRDQEAQLARKIALKRSRADATRWHGWQEFQAIPWY